MDHTFKRHLGSDQRNKINLIKRRVCGQWMCCTPSFISLFVCLRFCPKRSRSRACGPQASGLKNTWAAESCEDKFLSVNARARLGSTNSDKRFTFLHKQHFQMSVLWIWVKWPATRTNVFGFYSYMRVRGEAKYATLETSAPAPDLRYLTDADVRGFPRHSRLTRRQGGTKKTGADKDNFRSIIPKRSL